MVRLALPLWLVLVCTVPFAAKAKEAAFDYAVPTMLTLSAADGTRLSLGRFAGPAGQSRCLLIAPGFGQRSGTDTMRFVAGLLTPTVEVVILDFRGTGDSGGRYHFGAEERQDLQAALSWAQPRYAVVDVLAMSMGGYIGVCSAAEGPLRPRQLLLMSPPTSIEDIVASLGFLAHPFDLLWNHHKQVAHGSVDAFFRWGSLFAAKPKADVLAAKADVPMHFLVGGHDFLVFKRLSRRIFDAAPSPKSWTEWPEGGHAEHMALEDPPAFVAWARTHLSPLPKQGLGAP